jgi:tripartite ATP-independent transporter DctP family solute receptor
MCLPRAWKDMGGFRMVLRIGFEGSMASAQGIGAQEMARVAAQLSNGKISLEFSPDATLGSGPAMIAMVRKGELDIFFGGVGYFSALDSRFNVFDIPYLFANVEQAYKVVDGKFGREMLSVLEPHGLKGLGFWENGIRSITNNRQPIYRPEDVQGLKIRIMPGVPLYERLWRLVGAETTEMPSGAIYKAIEEGTIDSQEHPVSVLYARKFYEVQKYLSLTRHLYGPLLEVMNLRTFNSLNAQQQEILFKAAYAGALAMRSFSNDNETRFLEEMKARGLQVNEVDTKPFKEKMRPAIEQDFIEKNGDDWLQKIYAALSPDA